jgi:glycosyltransferase involved in cell wall biosynthesis
MKILLSSLYLPPIAGGPKIAIGGAEMVVWEMATRLAMRHEVHILAAGRWWGLEKKCGILIHKIPLPLFFTELGRFAIRPPLKHMNFDIMHCHMVGLWGRVIPKIINHDKLIVTCHGEGVFPRKLKSKLVAEPVLKSADIVSCVSKWMVDYVKREYGVNGIYIPNGVNERFKPLNMKRSKNMILYAGRLIERKGIFELLKAAKNLQEYKFYFAGEGSLADRITLSNTKYIGFIQNDKMPLFYNKATISIFPSYSEGLPMVGLEAMSCGCPIIASRCPGFLEVLEDGKTGVLIKSKSVSAIIDSISNLMENEELRNKIGRNAIIESKKYNWDNITEKYEAVYHKLLNMSEEPISKR